MVQTNLSTKKKQTHRHREQIAVVKLGGWLGEVWTGSLVLVDANYYI